MRDVKAGDRVLLLQGPMGPFFKRLAHWLTTRGALCWKINFNGGDWFYFRNANTFDFLGELEEWPEYLEDFLLSHRIDKVFLFGDCRELHSSAREVCKKLGVRVMVFEEGYIRPDYITLEEGGVNANSSTILPPEFFRSLPDQRETGRHPAGTRFRRMAWAAINYYLFSFLLSWRYSNYEHHKSLSLLKKSGVWILSGIRKTTYKSRDRKITARLATELSGNYFLVPLQVHNDSQVTCHSSYKRVQVFIQEVLKSFSQHAPDQVYLVIKHHPMDRGHHHYEKLIRRLADRYGISQRVVYAHELHLPTCLKHALGVVLINSTVGLSSLLHSIPTKTLGWAMYDMPGLTCQKPLEQFWTEPTPVDQELFAKYRNYLVEKSQLNGSFYGRFPLESVNKIC